MKTQDLENFHVGKEENKIVKFYYRKQKYKEPFNLLIKKK